MSSPQSRTIKVTLDPMLGLFQKLSLGGAHIFLRPLHPQDTHGVRAPRPPGHVSALINLPHYGSNTPWPPGQVNSPLPTCQTHCQQNTLHPQDKKVCPPRIISGTALNTRRYLGSTEHTGFQTTYAPPPTHTHQCVSIHVITKPVI